MMHALCLPTECTVGQGVWRRPLVFRVKALYFIIFLHRLYRFSPFFFVYFIEFCFLSKCFFLNEWMYCMGWESLVSMKVPPPTRIHCPLSFLCCSGKIEGSGCVLEGE